MPHAGRAGRARRSVVTRINRTVFGGGMLVLPPPNTVARLLASVRVLWDTPHRAARARDARPFLENSLVPPACLPEREDSPCPFINSSLPPWLRLPHYPH